MLGRPLLKALCILGEHRFTDSQASQHVCSQIVTQVEPGQLLEPLLLLFLQVAHTSAASGRNYSLSGSTWIMLTCSHPSICCVNVARWETAC